VFDVVAAAAIKVAGAAVFAGGVADAFGCGQQVDKFCRVAVFAFGVARLGMADQAIDIFLRRKVESL
jgi:hypothetical protein